MNQKLKLATRFIALGIFVILPFAAQAQHLWYDEFSTTKLQEVQAHLESFGVMLRGDDDLIGYIGYFAGPRDRLSKIHLQARDAKSYLEKRFPQLKGRIKIIFGGRHYKRRFILEPRAKCTEPPDFKSFADP